MTQSMIIKCQCTPKSENGRCKVCSAYKMVFLLKNGNNHLKEYGYNPVRYSYVSKNRKGMEYNVTGMMRRFQNDELMKFSNVIYFYENTPGGRLVAEKRL